MDFSRIWRASKPGAPGPGANDRLPPALRAALAELEHIRRIQPSLGSLVPTIAGVLEAAFAVPGAPVPSLSAGDEQTAFLLERIREGWNAGVPAVRVITPALDRARLLERARAIDAVVGRDQPQARAFRARLGAEPDRIGAWVCDLLAAGAEALAGPLEQDGLDPAYVLSTFRLSLLGELGEWSMRITGHGPELPWSRCECPVCGAAPALAEARGLEQQRVLRCLQCGAGWPGNRLRCAHCGKTDHRVLRYLFAEEDQGRFRLAICDACGGRLKIMTTLAPLSPPGLVVAEFAMLHLDLIDERCADGVDP